jgi:hypothetical protein
MKTVIFPVLIATPLFLFPQAISLTNNNMPSSGDTLRYTNVALNSIGNYSQTGTNFNWDFSNVTPTTEGVRAFKASAQTPYSFFFVGLNEYGEKVADTLLSNAQIPGSPVTITKYWNYYKKQSSPVNAFIADGAGMTISGLPVPSYYTDKDELYVFPLTYPNYDSTSFKFSTPSTSVIPIIYTKAGKRITKVDGWGTVKTPYGTENCIRLTTTQYSQDTIKLTLLGFPIKVGIPNTQRSYQWMTLTSKIPYFEVTGNLLMNNFTPATARFRGSGFVKPPPPKDDTGIEDEGGIQYTAYPNPVKDKLVMCGLQSGAYKATVFNTLGVMLGTRSVQSTESTHILDVSDLNAGTYLVMVEGGSAVRFVKIVKD